MGAQLPERSMPGTATNEPAVWARSGVLPEITRVTATDSAATAGASNVVPTLRIRSLLFSRCGGCHVFQLLLIFGIHGLRAAQRRLKRDVKLVRPFVKERIFSRQIIWHGAPLAVSDFLHVAARIQPVLTFLLHQVEVLRFDQRFREVYGIGRDAH